MPFQPEAASARFVALGRWLTIATRIAIPSVGQGSTGVGREAVTEP
jgi:hypothetical protein